MSQLSIQKGRVREEEVGAGEHGSHRADIQRESVRVKGQQDRKCEKVYSHRVVAARPK
jgi:hypothetical protein